MFTLTRAKSSSLLMIIKIILKIIYSSKCKQTLHWKCEQLLEISDCFKPKSTQEVVDTAQQTEDVEAMLVQRRRR